MKPLLALLGAVVAFAVPARAAAQCTTAQCAIGTVCYVNGQRNPMNSDCQYCASAVSRTTWTADPGAPCDDGVFCSVADACTSAGTCTGLPRACGDTLPCTTDSCNEATRTCDHLVVSGECEIGGGCYVSGDHAPGNSCLICDPARGASVWSVVSGEACDDGEFCTMSDFCDSSGTCRGTPNPCEDGLSCTTGSCDDRADMCVQTMLTDACMIDGACISNGTPNPANECEACIAATSTSAWSARAGARCDDGLFCTTGDACDAAGGCMGTARSCDDGDPCTDDRCSEATARCENVATGACGSDSGVSGSDAGAGGRDAGATSPPAASDDGCGCRVVARRKERGAGIGSALRCAFLAGIALLCLGRARSRRRALRAISQSTSAKRRSLVEVRRPVAGSSSLACQT